MHAVSAADHFLNCFCLPFDQSKLFTEAWHCEVHVLVRHTWHCTALYVALRRYCAACIAPSTLLPNFGPWTFASASAINNRSTPLSYPGSSMASAAGQRQAGQAAKENMKV